MVVWNRLKLNYSCAAHRSPISMKAERKPVARLRAFLFGILIGLAILGVVFTMI